MSETGSDLGLHARSGALRGADGLALAASPTFAVMALLSAVATGGPAEMLCGGSSGSPLSGMATMYLLMSAFHARAWLTLAGARRRRQGASTPAQ